jgi:hypothetical protein
MVHMLYSVIDPSAERASLLFNIAIIYHAPSQRKRGREACEADLGSKPRLMVPRPYTPAAGPGPLACCGL